jgi:hypothetical protein
MLLEKEWLQRDNRIRQSLEEKKITGIKRKENDLSSIIYLSKAYFFFSNHLLTVNLYDELSLIFKKSGLF